MASFKDLLNPSPKPQQTKVDKDEAKKSLADYTTQQRGTGKSARVGIKFENEIARTCDIYESRGLAYIQKFTPPTVFVPPKNGKKGFMMYSKKTGFDFVGAYLISDPIHDFWQPIFIETKTTEPGNIPVGNDKTGIKDHQLTKMLQLQKLGLECFFVWKIRSAGVIFKFTPNQLIDAIGTKKSLSLLDCDENHFEKVIPITIEGESYYDILGLL